MLIAEIGDMDIIMRRSLEKNGQAVSGYVDKQLKLFNVYQNLIEKE